MPSTPHRLLLTQAPSSGLCRTSGLRFWNGNRTFSCSTGRFSAKPAARVEQGNIPSSNFCCWIRDSPTSDGKPCSIATPTIWRRCRGFSHCRSHHNNPATVADLLSRSGSRSHIRERKCQRHVRIFLPVHFHVRIDKIIPWLAILRGIQLQVASHTELHAVHVMRTEKIVALLLMLPGL